MEIRQIQQNYNTKRDVNFGKLKKIIYDGAFNPSKCELNYRFVEHFLEDDEIKKICDKYDVTAKFSQYIVEALSGFPDSGLYNIYKSSLKITAEKIKKPTNLIQKFKNLFKNNDKKIYEIQEGSTNGYEESLYKLFRSFNQTVKNRREGYKIINIFDNHFAELEKSKKAKIELKKRAADLLNSNNS